MRTTFFIAGFLAAMTGKTHGLNLDCSSDPAFTDSTLSALSQIDTTALLDLTRKGETGSPGPRGDKGPRGQTGPPGNKGSKGATGAQGDKGRKGADGPKGAQGQKGDKGPTGDKGKKG